jgi:hypothetical protein
VNAVFRTIVSIQARGLTSALQMARKARKHESGTTSSASARLPVIQRASE